MYCKRELPGFVECNCDEKFKNKDLWNYRHVSENRRKQRQRDNLNISK